MQRYYKKPKEYAEKLREYVVKIKACRQDRDSPSKTGHDATFMRVKKDVAGDGGYNLYKFHNKQMRLAKAA
ncbi:hypothetical protein AALC25_11715 [Lachnospiraceae bacterium 29-84]